MWFETVFAPDHQVLTVRVQGRGEADLVPQMVIAIRSAPEFRPGMRVLIDAIDTDYLPSTGDAMAFAMFLKGELPGSRLALFLRAGAQYNLACVVEAPANQLGIPFAVFRDRDEATRWLTEGS